MKKKTKPKPIAKKTKTDFKVAAEYRRRALKAWKTRRAAAKKKPKAKKSKSKK